MSKRRDRRKQSKKDSKSDDDEEDDRTPATSMSWAGTGAKVNSLTGKGKFNPRIPIDQPGDEGDDALIWSDVPFALEERLKDKPQLITCLLYTSPSPRDRQKSRMPSSA